MHKSKVRTSLPNLEVDGALLGAGRNATVNSAAGVRETERSIAVRRIQLRLDEVVVAVDADDDFGSVKLMDLPDGNLGIMGALVNVTFVGADGVDTPEDADIGLGTAAASASTLATTMINVADKIDATSGGVVQGGGVLAPLALAASSDAIYLNVGCVIGTDGTLTFSGTIEVFILDLGDPAA